MSKNRRLTTNYLEDAKKYFLFSYKFGTMFSKEDMVQAHDKVNIILEQLGLITDVYNKRLVEKNMHLVYMICYMENGNLKVLSTRNAGDKGRFLVEALSFGSDFRTTIPAILGCSNNFMQDCKDNHKDYSNIPFAVYAFEKKREEK